jgi:dihydrofolate reductase
MKFSIIAAADRNFGIGKNRTLPWDLKSELKYFSETTSKTEDPSKQNALIMGSVTWESLPGKSRPLKNRLNIVLNPNTEYTVPEGVLRASSFEEAQEFVNKRTDIENTFIIGGGSVYAYAISKSECDKIYLTRIDHDFECDTFFPNIDPNIFEIASQSESKEENGLQFAHYVYKRQ